MMEKNDYSKEKIITYVVMGIVLAVIVGRH